ncbi:MAG: hypothetical protein ACYS8Y_01220 [Planctomycetota bacterium]|jgi:hypothetical protein
MRNTTKRYTQPAFLICVAVLAVAAGGMSTAIKSLGVYLKKKPLPMKKPLDLLNEKKLAPYKIVSKEKIENEEEIKALGTKDYIRWCLEDTSVAADSPVRHCYLLITYYKLPDLVPHIPEECYTGVGYQKISSDIVTFEINKGGIKEKIPGRYLVFTSTSSNLWTSIKFPVLYLFSVNGKYTNSREDTRIILNKNLFGEYSYFSKVEWNFFNTKFGAKTYLTKEQTLAASQKLLDILLPILESEHWHWPPNATKGV